MPAAIPVALAITAAAGIYGAVEQNQQLQHAKGAEEAQQKAIQDQIDAQAKSDKTNQDAKNNAASATQQAAIQALRASMSSTGGAGGTILTGPQGTATGAPIATKTLLGA